MLFSSPEFILLFLPAVALVYYILPKRAKNDWLLLASLFFYAWGEPKFVFVMLLSIVFNYYAALAVEKREKNSQKRKAALVLTVTFNLALLFVFKYLNFATGILQSVFPSVSQTNIALPIGISFFTFQAMSYVIDVYRGIPAQKNIRSLGLYISFFPQLIAGPIVRYTTVMDEIESRSVAPEDVSEGIRRFLIGFNKKILLANAMAEVADKAFAAAELSVGMAWLGIVCYDLQIFFDFCGYSDMAIGLGRMFGFHFLENFNYPYISKSVTEFWRRWHISLGSWFRDYVYFPLGGSHVKSKGRLVLNLAVVWLLTGVWHGANYTFLLWGALHGVLIIAEKLTDFPKKIEKNGFIIGLSRIYTLLAVSIGWVFFRADSISAAWSYLGAMFGGAALSDSLFRFELREYALVLAAALLCATPVFKILSEKSEERGSCLGSVIDWLVDIILFTVSLSFLIMNAYNPFIYFNF